MTTQTSSKGSIRELIAELAEVEDSVRRTKTFATSGDPLGDALNPELLALLERESQIVSALRCMRGGAQLS